MPPTLDQLERFVSSPAYDADTAGLIASMIPALKAAGQPGELISPGVRRIRGNLCNVHGRYGPCDKAGSKKPKKGRKPAAPKKTDAQRATERDQKRQANTDNVAKQMANNDTGLSPSGSKALAAFAKGQQPDPAMGKQLATMGLAEQAADGSYRMTPTGRGVVSAMAAGDYQRAVDGISRATDSAGKRTERQTAAGKRQQDAAGKRAAAQVGRGLAQGAPAKAGDRAVAQIGGELTKRKPAKASAGGSKKPTAHAEPGAEKPRKATPAKRPSRGGTSGGSSGGGSSSGAAKPKQPAPAKRLDAKLTEAATALSEGAEVSDDQVKQLITNGLAKLNKDGDPVLTAAGLRATMKEAREVDTSRLEIWQHRKLVPPTGSEPTELATWFGWKPATLDGGSFKVFKDARNQYRWLAISSCAFEDRDLEVVSTKALQEDCDHADSTGEYGPLRWWHMPGVDIGDCDFNAMEGRMLIEMGTFRNPAIAVAVHKAAASLELSIGFLHLPTEPDADRVFHHIRRYERSLVPRGKASNRYTQLMVKEIPMLDTKEKEAIEKLGSSPEALAYMQEVLATASSRQKAAEAEGIRHKSDDSEAIYFDPQSQPGVIRDGQWIALKAFPPKADDAEAEIVVEEDAIDDMQAEVVEEDSDPNALTLSAGDIAAITEVITNAVGQIMGGLDLEKKVAGHVQGLLQPFQQAQATKETQVATQVAELTQQVKELTGDQPAVAPYRASSAKDSTLKTEQELLAAIKQVDGNDPWADIKMGLGLAPRQ